MSSKNGSIARLLMEDSFRTMYSYPRTLRSDCALQFENILLVIGNQGPAMLSLALGIERFCAIRFPTTYRHFKEKMFHVLLILSAVICITSLCVALYIGLVIEKDLLASLPCTLSNAFGFTYTLMNFVSVCSVIMVVIPNMFLYVTRFNFFTLDYVILGWLNCAFVSRSAFSLHLLGFRSPRFRQRVSELFGYSKIVTKPSQIDAIKSTSIPEARRQSRRPTETSQIIVF
uniref:G-protein coupled receptors family 1 profile domain-containing protein n=1 Tax=Panagrolaimus davidi TaxID=227884 RepID=A0A914Q4P8_9BILA